MFQKELLNSKEIKQKKLIIALILFGYKKLQELDNINNFDIRKMKNILNTIHNQINTNKKNFTLKEFNNFLDDMWDDSEDDYDKTQSNIIIQSKQNKLKKTNKRIKVNI